MTDALRFSFQANIVGKDSTTYEFTDQHGKVRTKPVWSKYRNRFYNHSGKVLDESQNVLNYREFNRIDFMELVAVKGYATSFILKDDKLEKGRSQEHNIAGACHIMVDFDNTMDMAEVMKHPWWKKAYFAYTTPSFGKIQGELEDTDLIKLPEEQALIVLNQVGKPKRNFRLVFRFNRFITAEELADVGPGFMSIFPLADRSCVDLARLMFGQPNAMVEAPDEEYMLTDADIEELMQLGQVWRVENKKQQKIKIDAIVGEAKLADGSYSLDTEITLASGKTMTVQEIMDDEPDGFHEPCYSPFRTESNPSAFVKKWDSGSVFICDSGAQLKHTWKRSEGLALRLKVRKNGELEVVEKQEAREEITLHDVTESQREYNECSTNEVRDKTMSKVVDLVLDSRSKHFAVRTAEGYGKSTKLVKKLLAKHKRIGFFCLSNVQADEKMKDFAEFNPHRILSRGAIIEQEYGVKPVYNEQNLDEFGDPGLDEDATIALIVETTGKPFTRGDLAELSQRAMDTWTSDAKIVIGTFAMGYRLFQNAFGQLKRIIIVDDPSTDDFVTSRFVQDAGYTKPPMKVAEREVEEVYFGAEFWGQDKVIFTTTEELVLKFIQFQHPTSVVIDEDEKLDTHRNVTILPNTLVHKVTRPLIPAIHKRVMQNTKSEQHLIINGANEKLNMWNTKGRNDLQGDSVIIATKPHQCSVYAILDSLGADEVSRHEIEVKMVVDQVNQAIGRGQGYRGGNNKTLIVCDPALQVSLMWHSRYSIESWEGMQRRGRLHGVPVTFATDIPDWIVEWYSYLNTWKQWTKVEEGFVRQLLHHEFIAYGVTKRQEADIRKELSKVTQLSSLLWQKHEEMIDEEGTRRRYRTEVIKLVEKFNENKLVESNKAKFKKRKFVSPEGEAKMFTPGSEPKGWVKPSPKKKPTTRVARLAQAMKKFA